MCSAGSIEGLCVEIDGLNVCVLLEIVERVYAKIDDSLCVFCWNLVTVDMLELLQHVRCVFLPKCEFSSELVIRYRNGVGCSELTFSAESCVLQRIYDSLSKLCHSKRISIRCPMMCSEANL